MRDYIMKSDSHNNRYVVWMAVGVFSGGGDYSYKKINITFNTNNTQIGKELVTELL